MTVKITVIGTGYVGLVAGACFADTGNEVWCVDNNKEKVAGLQKGNVPIFETGLEPLVKRGLGQGRLTFTTDLRLGIEKSEICFLAVDTPSDKDGKPDITHLVEAAKALADLLEPPILVITKSTVPVGTTLRIRSILDEGLKARRKNVEGLMVASNPEFLREGSAVFDFQRPDRIVVGTDSEEAARRLKELYAPFMRKQDCLLLMDIASAEMSKYASNAMLATRISFMNEIAGLCERMGADCNAIRRVIGWDPRIGRQYLYPGLGFGGSCLPKDLQALIQIGREKNQPIPLLESVAKVNRGQRERLFGKIIDHFGSEDRVKEKVLALWGIAFKPETDDIREAPALYLIEKLTALEAKIRAFDPVAGVSLEGKFGSRVLLCKSPYECLKGADALIIATEWNLFRNPNFSKMLELMQSPVVFDGRNLYSPKQMRSLGFKYFCMGC